MQKRIMAALVALTSTTGLFAATLETSRLFEPYTDNVSHVQSYLLRPGLVDWNQQSLYYTQRAMTDDGRFFVFAAAPEEQAGKKFRKQGIVAVVDFQNDTIIKFTDAVRGPCSFLLDTVNDALYEIRADACWRRDLRVNPTNEIKLCDISTSLKGLGVRVARYYTHPTFTADHKGLFLDALVIQSERPKKTLNIAGVLDFTTGTFTEWHRDAYTVRHGAANPVRKDVALALMPYGYSHVQAHNCAAEGVCRRLLLMTPHSCQMILPQVPVGGKKPVHVVHTEWDAQGQGIYWCSYANGIMYHDIDTGAEQVLMKDNCAVHCEMTDDKRYIVFDQSSNEQRKFRGQAWQVGFYDRNEKKTTWIYTARPEFATPEQPSNLHPDPHPQFVRNGQYVISTFTVKPKQISVLITPTAPLMKGEEVRP